MFTDAKGRVIMAQLQVFHLIVIPSRSACGSA